MKESTSQGWGKRFREYARANGTSLAQVAEKLGRAESTVRSWTNGTREINLAEFFQLCGAAEIDPVLVLFSGTVDAKFLEIGHAWGKAEESEREVFRTVAQGILAKHANADERDRDRVPPQGVPRRAGRRTRV